MLVEYINWRIWNCMIFRNYILTTWRLMIAKWWLSLIKIFSLTTGILSFLLVWLFYLDHRNFMSDRTNIFQSCTIENVLLLGFILLVTSLIYFLIMKSQISFRNKELFFRKFYGETSKGIASMLMIETSIFILLSFMFSLILIDQVAPLLNLITEKNIDLQHVDGPLSLLMILCFLIILGFIVGILPSTWYARYRAVDILKKLPH